MQRTKNQAGSRYDAGYRTHGESGNTYGENSTNGWTVVTADGKLSAHYENTIAITEDEPIILTMLA